MAPGRWPQGPSRDGLASRAPAEALGRNCCFLQGPRTDPDQVAAPREAIAAGREVSVDILNRRADGTPFRNRLLVAPVHGAEGRVSHFLGFQKQLSAEDARRRGGVPGAVSPEDALREVQHRVKNHLAMIVGLIRMEAREDKREGGGPGHYGTLARRVEGLQLLYKELSAAGPSRGAESIALGDCLGRIYGAIVRLDGRPGVRLHLDVAELTASVETAARIGLIVSEVVTNALEHAFAGRTAGVLAVRFQPHGPRGVRIEARDDGVSLAPGIRWPDMGSMGGRIVAGLVDGLGARPRVGSGPGGRR